MNREADLQVKNALADLGTKGFGGRTAVEILVEGYFAAAAQYRLEGQVPSGDTGIESADILEAAIMLARERGISAEEAEVYAIQGLLDGATWAGRSECVIPWG